MSVNKPFSAGSMADSLAANAAPQPTARPQRSWMALSPIAGLSRNATSETLMKAATACSEVLKTMSLNEGFVLEIVKIDNTLLTNLRFSGLAIVARYSDKNSKAIAYHTLLLEGSADPMQPRVINNNGQQLAIDQFTCDAFNETYLTTVDQALASAYPGMDRLPASGAVVPRTFNWDDTVAVRNLLVNSGLASASSLHTNSADFQDISLAEFDRSAGLQTTVSFQQPESQDYVGLPVRTDMTMRLSAVAIGAQDQSNPNNQEREITLAEAGGFIDLTWAPSAPIQGFMVTNQPTQKFVARVILSSLVNLTSASINSQLLALIAAAQVTEGQNWIPYYLPRHGNTGLGDVDIKDIGAINIEANLENNPSGFGTPVDTKAADFNNQALGRLLASTIRPGIALALDVSLCGTDTWYNEVFSAASSLHPTAQSAQVAILRAADRLTNNHFSTIYTTDESPIFQGEDEILTGYYIDKNGVKKDLRDLDYLAVMNLAGVKDPRVGQDWTDTFTNTNFSRERRLDARKRIIQQLLPSAVFTGRALRVTCNPKFIEALVKAAAAAGLQMRTVNSAANMEFQNNRGQASWANNGLLSGQASGLYSTGFGRTTPVGAARPVFSRW